MKVCNVCHQENRPVAKYCKKCAQLLPVNIQANLSDSVDMVWDELCGLNQLKKDFQDKLVVARNMKLVNREANNRNFHTVLLGNTGSGKSKAVEVITKALFQNGIISKPKAHNVIAADFGEYARNLGSNMGGLKGCVLFIDGVHLLVKNNQAHLLDKLYHEMDKSYGDPIVIVGSRADDFQEYLNKNQEIKGRFKDFYYLPDFTAKQMMDVAIKTIQEKNYQIAEDSLLKLKKRFLYICRNQFSSDGMYEEARNGFLVGKEVEKIENCHFSNPNFQQNPSLILPDDIQGELFQTKTVEEIISELDEFVGMSEVKTFIKNLIGTYETQRRDAELTGKNTKVGAHIILTGNPGTGKTTLARKLGEIFASADILSSGHVIEVDRSKLVSEFLGQTPRVVQKYCDEALGGVLFVDEAYTLKADDNDQAGQQAIEALMKRMEDDRDKFIVIAAGYQKEMQNFVNANPGMKSRANYTFHLPDYKPKELFEIFKVFVKKGGYQLSQEAGQEAQKALKSMFDLRDSKFGNGRDVRTFFEEVLSKRADRLRRTGEHTIDIVPEDIPGQSEEITADTLEDILTELNEMVGLSGVKDSIRRIADSMEVERRRMQDGAERGVTNRHVLFKGNPGTGKTTVARILGKVYKRLGVLKTDTFIEVTSKDLIAPYVGQSALLTNKVIDQAMGGVLFIDEAYTLNPNYSGGSSTFAQDVIDTLLVRLSNDEGKFVVIAAGYPQLMDDLRRSNMGIDQRFPIANEIIFEDYKPEELHQIFLFLVKKNTFYIEEEASIKALRLMEDLYRQKTDTFGNAREVKNQFQVVKDRQSQRVMGSIRAGETPNVSFIIAQDIPGGELISTEVLLSELNSLIGLGGVKQQVQSLMNYLENEKEKAEAGGEKTQLNLHFTFKGSPGTGKTTVARIMAKIFKGIGLLPKGQLIEVSAKDLVAGYVGQTAKKTNDVVTQAIGGVLFIDEAYTLIPGKSGNSFGQEAIDTLLQRMENDKGKFVVIAAGYPEQIDDFLACNPGFPARFTRDIFFEDYVPSELQEIFLAMCTSKRYKLADGFEAKSAELLEKVHRNRDKNFANARTVRNLFEQVLVNQSDRITRHRNSHEMYDPLLLTVEDLPLTKKEPSVSIEDALHELDGLIGLGRVKRDVSSIINFLKIEKKRAERGGKETTLNLHFIFKGSPGTGKTTVARILAKILKALEIIPEGHLVETDRKDLVGEYVGHTATKTSKVIDKAMGGVLFVDEAYALAPKGNSNDFGKEAIDTLLVRMENDRGKFVVIAAGYSRDMDRFLSINEGLPSRFPRTIEFDDYTGEEMAQIFDSMVKTKGMRFAADTYPLIEEFFTMLYHNRDNSFANGRTVRNIFEKALQKQADRLVALSAGTELTDDMYDEIDIADIQ